MWQLHHFNYFKRFKIVHYIIFNEILCADFLSIFREYWLKSGDVLSRKFPNFGRHLGFLSIRANLKSIFVYLREYFLQSKVLIHPNIYIRNYLQSINTTFMPFIKK